MYLILFSRHFFPVKQHLQTISPLIKNGRVQHESVDDVIRSGTSVLRDFGMGRKLAENLR